MQFKWLDFKITNRCNNHCTYCGVKQDPPQSIEKIPMENLRQTVQDAINAGFTHFAFLGGEPSLRKDFPQIVDPLQNESRVESVMVISNMLIFNEAMYRGVFKTQAKHAQVVTSIDNLTMPNYKNQNTSQTLEYIVRIQALAREYQKQGKGSREVHVHSVISRENFQNLVPHIQFFHERGIDVSMAIVEPFVLIDHHTPESLAAFNQFTREDVDAIIQQLNNLEQQGLLNWANTVLREYLMKMIYNSLNGSRYRECTAGSAHVIIESDGNVYPCLTEAYRKGLKFGNILTERFQDIFARMAQFRCEAPFQQSCWDHYLWTKLEKVVEGK